MIFYCFQYIIFSSLSVSNIHDFFKSCSVSDRDFVYYLLVTNNFMNILLIITTNKPGTAQVGAISKAQKNSKTTFSTTGDNKSSQKTKN